ncbi:MAG: DnaJ domain-containing protein [Leptolyngbyaceae cyanobacterium RM2_2_4]|nr:DnaJ domain-containing protein [Leptolyngbyaceae cyanobacterium SM1_4_3]NJN89696.1 DnaJ domain-containing protein [Leptolyngbyaceae cyanobacterium SL_5_14]NJO53193.1 DnaJ domain-containing protein [Leptolyngbyaceae cyanobacterium RM2_2_4]
MDCADRYYQILDLSPGASKHEVKQAYKDLIVVWHPDRFTHNPRLQQKAQEKVKEINAAYTFLKSYDSVPEKVSTAYTTPSDYTSPQNSVENPTYQSTSYQDVNYYDTPYSNATYQDRVYQNATYQTQSKPVDLSYLQLLMASGRWKDADHETKAILLRVMDREEAGWLSEEDVSNLPVETLAAIDRLWVRYSNGRFGFSTQSKIWHELNCKTNSWMFAQSKSESKFGTQIGWYVNNIWLLQWDAFKYGFRAPAGSLPREYIFALSGWWTYSQQRSGYLLWRFEEVFLRLESADV